VLQLIKKISREKNQTMVMVTHDNYLAGFGDRIIQIKDGKIIRNVDNREQAKAQMDALLNQTAASAEQEASGTETKNGSIWEEVNGSVTNTTNKRNEGDI